MIRIAHFSLVLSLCLVANATEFSAQCQSLARNVALNLGPLTNFRQTTTRGFALQLGKEIFQPNEIDFLSALPHIRIHLEGEIAGSQFRGFLGPEHLVGQLRAALPNDLHYDQFGRAELTLEFKDRKIGFTGVVSKAELLGKNPDFIIKKGQRMPGGVPAWVQGIKGAWFAEMEKDPSGKWVVKLGEDGEPANPNFKFEPDANLHGALWAVPTDLVTIIIEKDRSTGKPTVLTLFPGENAPAFPTRIEKYEIDTLSPDSPESLYWESHVFLRF